MEIKEVKLWCFDWDGVVKDSMELIYKTAMKVFRHFGLLEVSFDQFLAEFRQPAIGYYRNKGLPAEITAAEMKAVFFRHYAEEPEPDCVSGTHELLWKIETKGLPMAIISSHYNIVEVEEWLKKKKLFDFFTSLCGMAVDKAPVLQQLAYDYEIGCHRVVLIGDMPQDMEDAKRAGAIAIGLVATESMRPILLAAGADHVVGTPQEILSLI